MALSLYCLDDVGKRVHPATFRVDESAIDRERTSETTR